MLVLWVCYYPCEENKLKGLTFVVKVSSILSFLSANLNMNNEHAFFW